MNKKFALFRYRTENLGDDIQSLAIAAHLPQVNALVDRDNLSELIFDVPHHCVMNSWFFMGADKGPPSQSIIPIFHGFCVGRNEMLEGEWLEYLRANAPIGCRDKRSVQMLHEVGVDAYWSGCLTLMLGQSLDIATEPVREEILIVDISKERLKGVVPDRILNNATFISNELDVFAQSRTSQRFKAAQSQIERLSKAKLVITRRLHIALPCVGFQTPVIAIPNPLISDARHRFSGYEEFLPIIWPESQSIDFDYFNPKPVQIPHHLYTRLEQTLEKIGKNAHKNICPLKNYRQISIICNKSERKHIALKCGIDTEITPILNQSNIRIAEIENSLVSNKIIYDVETIEAKDSARELLNDYSFRSSLDKIADLVALQKPIREIDAMVRRLAVGENLYEVSRFWLPFLRASREYQNEITWLNTSLKMGYDPYDAGSLVSVLWFCEASDIDEQVTYLKDLLLTKSFSMNNDVFHIGKCCEILDSFLDVFGYLNSEISLAEIEEKQIHPFVIDVIYKRIWGYIATLELGKVKRLAVFFIRAVIKFGWPQTSLVWPIHYFLEANNFLIEARGAIKSIVEPKDQQMQFYELVLDAKSNLQIDLLSRRLTKLLENLNYQLMLDNEFWQMSYINALEIIGSDLSLFDAEFQKWSTFDYHKANRKIRAQISVIASKLAWKLSLNDEALIWAKRAVDLQKVNISEALDTIIDILVKENYWSDAHCLIENAYKGLNASLDDISSISYENVDIPNALESHKVWFCAGQGIGDDIVRLAILKGLKFNQKNVIYDIDSRLLNAAQNANQWIKFRPKSRVYVKNKFSGSEFWQDRIGVPTSLDAYRLTKSHINFAKKGGALLQNEFLLAQFFKHREDFSTFRGPLFVASKETSYQVAQYLRNSTSQNKKIAIAWRSNDLSGARADYFFNLLEILPLLKNIKFDFVIVQHDLTKHEIDILKDFANVHVPNCDLKNDLEFVGELMRQCDLTIAPKLSTRELAAGFGARVLSLTIGYNNIEQWRIDNLNQKDCIFANITHLQQCKILGKEDILDLAQKVIEIL